MKFLKFLVSIIILTFGKQIFCFEGQKENNSSNAIYFNNIYYEIEKGTFFIYSIKGGLNVKKIKKKVADQIGIDENCIKLLATEIKTSDELFFELKDDFIINEEYGLSHIIIALKKRAKDSSQCTIL